MTKTVKAKRQSSPPLHNVQMITGAIAKLLAIDGGLAINEFVWDDYARALHVSTGHSIIRVSIKELASVDTDVEEYESHI